jgi:hypothetical protein
VCKAKIEGNIGILARALTLDKVFQAEKNAKTSPHKTFTAFLRYAHSNMHLFPWKNTKIPENLSCLMVNRA